MGDGTKDAGLAARPELWPRVLEIIPGGVVEMRADGSIVHANAHAVELLGLSYDALTNRYAQDFAPETIHVDGRPCPASEYPILQALTTGAPSGPTTIGVVRPDGATRWATFSAIPVLEEDGTVAGAVVTFLEVTDRIRAETALSTSEAQLRTILETAPEVILSTDPAGRITFINRTVPELTPEACIGLDIRSFVSDATRPAIEAAIEQAVERRATARYEADDPYGRPFEAVVAPVIEDGEVASLTFVCTDVSESRHLRAQLMISDRMASVGTLAAGVAHEINNPLTYVLASLRHIERELWELDTPDLVRRVEQATEGAERISGIVRDLGTFAGERVAADARCNVEAVVDTTLRLASNQTRYRAKVSTRGGPVPFVRAEPSRLGQVILNLVVNAAQAIPEGRADAHTIVVSWEALSEDQVAILVTDDGDGIPPAQLSRVFEPFFTTKPAGVGTGLGLYICKNIIASFGGTIGIESELGRGTTVRLVLPTASRSARPSTPPAADLEAGPGGARLLIVEDEPLVRRVIAEALSDYEVSACASGREALGLLMSEDFDLILCDLIMPDITGMDVYAALEQERPELCERVVFMSGGAFTERSQAFRRATKSPFLDKPFSMEDLLGVVARRLAALTSRG